MYTVITGASSGIGRELARLFAKDGYDLVLVARNEEKLNQLAKELKTKDNDIIVASHDLSDQTQCIALFDKVKTLDIRYFINNAGYGNLGFFNETDASIEQNMLDLNIRSVQTLTKLFLQHFDQGDVVNVGSMAGVLPTPTFATYAASKAYVNHLSMAVNYELKRQNRKNRVLLVAPGPVLTNFSKRANAHFNRGMTATKCANIIFKGIKKRKPLIIPGLAMKLAYVFSKITPRKLLLRISYKFQTNK